jgi:hypothetical protein
MYLSFFLTSLVSFFILKKKTPLMINLSYSFIVLISIIIGFDFLDIKFVDDGEYYWDIATALYDDYDQSHLANPELYTRHNGIFYLGYLVFNVFGYHLLSLACFYLLTKSIICIYLFNFLSRKIDNFKNNRAIFFLLILFEPWTIIFNNFHFLKEGFIFFLSAIIVINLYKFRVKLKIKYLIIVILSIVLMFSFRYYHAYLFVIFFFLSNIFLRSNFKSKIFFNYFLFFFISILLIDFSIFGIFTENYIFTYINEIRLEILGNISFIAPIKFIFSPFSINIFIKEGDLFRTFLALIYNFMSILLIISFLKNDYKNNFINFLYFFIIFFSIAQLWVPSELMTGGRHRSVIIWAIPILITYYYTTKKKYIIST